MKETTQQQTAAANGGDLIFTPGRGAAAGVAIPGRDGRIIFRLANGQEVLRFDPDGSVYVRGKSAGTDQDVYESFREWLATARAELGPGATIDG